MAESLAEALPAEMARVRDELIPVYMSVPNGNFAATLMRRDLDIAAKVMVEGDLPGMVAIYQALREWKL